MKSTLITQYCIATLLGLLIFLLLKATPEGALSLSLPDHKLIDHPWVGSDTMTYVRPAEAFLDSFTFERDGIPDMHRTVGYPLFLAAMMSLFHEDWVLPTYIVQIAIFMVLFPSVTYIAESLTPGRSAGKWPIFIALLLMGICVAYVGQLLTDQLFVSFLYLGIACGFFAIRHTSWLPAILHIAFIGYAAQIRPTLSLFFIADFFLLIYIARFWEIRISRKILLILTCIIIAVAVVGNGPAIRNYVNHGMFTPTDVFANNLARYLAGPVLISEGQASEYYEKEKLFKAIEGVERIETQKEFAFKVYQEFPIATLKRLTYHAVWNLFEPHWEYILHVFGRGFSLNSFFDSQGNFNRSLLLNIPFTLWYVTLYFLFILSLITLKCKDKMLLLFGTAFFLLPLFVSFINGQGARMRLFAEPFILVFAYDALYQILRKLRN